MKQNPQLLALGLAGGYLLGRTRKAKFALAVASYVLGRRKGIAPQQLLTDGLKKLADTPEFARLSEQVRDELMSAGRSMVTAAANRRMDSLSDALHERTEALSAPGGVEKPDEEAEESGERPQDESAEEEEPEKESEEEPEEKSEEEPAARKAPPKKTAPKKAAPEKGSAGKRTAKKTASQQTAARKSTARGTAAKRSASRSTGRR